MQLSKEQKDQLIDKLQGYFFDERNEVLGTIGAENLVTFFLEECSPVIYNRALKDVKHVIEQQFASIEEELYVLEK